MFRIIKGIELLKYPPDFPQKKFYRTKKKVHIDIYKQFEELINESNEREIDRKQKLPDQHLGFCILSFDLAHIKTTGLFVVNIGHGTKVIRRLDN